MNGLSVIIPYWGESHRDNLNAMLDSWMLSGAMRNTELIIATEKGNTAEAYSLFGKGWVKNAPFDPLGQKWHLSTARNAGAAHATYDTLVFHDCDALFWFGWPDMVARWARKVPCFGTYNSIVYADRITSETLRTAVSNGILFPEKRIPNAKHAPLAGGGCGLSFCINRDLFNRVGPWKEYPGWGEEDVEYRNRICAVTGVSAKHLKQRVVPVPVVHLWHEEADKSHHPQNMKDARK